MDIDRLRKFCMSFPGATEQIQWQDDLLFKVGGKVFAVTPLEPSRLWLCVKADPEEFAELTERPGVIPAPYLARAKWIAVESKDALSPLEVERLIRKSYQLVSAKLPRKVREKLSTKSARRKWQKEKAARRKKRR
jgi:predicted DNA-binding protein (MmcQ/YjbR family)